ncbi:uncharacterized protein OCT59_013676 [Rhizophagus irregularis]|uniref:uncharacterized protein n=1 Tax=Rhizophagus irregularis TaxID=588596 RepID=UPI0033347923|nr:hypothetical protein OCT59_013676 [Rhizophagus irregularis]
MDFPKYNGNDSNLKLTRAKFALSLVDSNILLPTEIDSIVKLRKALKEDISFTIFKNTNKRKLQSLNYIPETLKHVATGKYLSSDGFCRGPEPDPNSLWKIKFGNELITYADTSIRFQHVKPTSNNFLGIDSRCTSPSTNYTEVSSCNNCYSHWHTYWNFNHSKLENYQGYLKSNDIINISIKKFYDRYCRYIKNGQVEFLRSHDIQFTIGNNTYQEVVCHNERLGGNDELIKQHTEP